MAYGNIDENEAGAPKKADVLIRSTQHIAMKQEELSEQTKQVAERLDEAIEQFSKSSQDSEYIVKQSGEIFSRLQSENAALKQELLYLAKQSENIYAGLAEKITEISDQSKNRDSALTALADRINDISEQTQKSGETYSAVIDKMTELAEQSKRNEKLFAELSEKLEAISEQNRKSEKAYGELSDKIVVSDRSETSDIGSTQLLDKINYISDQLRRSEGAHSMLADKFEILSMRVEQFGFESAKSPAYNRTTVAPVAYPVPAQTEVKAEIDYDKLAEKVADLLSTRDAISPEYIASKVAEQVVIPEIETANVNVTVDTHEIAKEVVQLIDEKSAKTQGAVATAAASGGAIDEDALVERIAQRMGGLKAEEIAPVSAVLDFDEDDLAERIAKKIGGFRSADSALPAVAADIDEDELADSIALKVGSLKAEDFEILVDDEGCTSISKEIAENLDYATISNIIADKLREALDLASVNAPDYEEMAERISEKITVAGINEEAIADKAAAALSNYLPEIDTDEIADKVTGAVIDVVSAMPQPTVDSETICNTISEKLIESQEDHDYDIVIDDEGISKITELVTEEIEKGTGARFDKVEEDIARLCELLTTVEEQPEPATAVAAQTAAESETVESLSADEQPEEQTEETAVQTAEVYAEADYTKISELVAAEIEKGTGSRFDKVEEDIAKLTELVSSVVVEDDGDYAEEEYDDYGEEDYSALSEVVATEIEKGVASRLTGIEENVAKITEYLTAEETDEADEETDEEQYEEEYDGEEAEDVEEAETEEEVEEEEVDEYAAISEIVAAEIEKGIENGVAARLDSVEENISKVEESIAKITEYITAEKTSEAAEAVQSADENQDDKEYVEIDDCTVLSEIVAAEIEKGIENVAVRISGIEENVAKITEYLTAEVENSDGEEYEEVEDYSALSEIVATEIDRGISFRLDSVEENIAKLTEFVEGNVGENIVKLTELVEGNVGENIVKLTELVEGSTENRDDGRFDKVQDDVAQIKEMLSNGVIAVSETAAAQAAIPVEEEAPDEEALVTVSDLVEPEEEPEEPAEEVKEEVSAQPAEEVKPEPVIVPVIFPVATPAQEQPEEEEEFEEDEEEDEDEKDDFSIDVLDMDAFSDDELMPGELSDYADGVDFANMMKFKRSFIARIIQSNDDYKQYYGEVKHALLSYKKVNSNVAWGAERFNKGRETIARMKIRGKTLCLYLALDPNNYKTSVYHHLDVSDNKSVAGTPMMVKIKSNLGVRKAIRLIDEMLAMRGGERKEIPERDYAAMYPYETIEELIDEGLVKDVRKK